MSNEKNRTALEQERGAGQEFGNGETGLDLASLLEQVRPFTQVPLPCLNDLAQQVRAVLMWDIPGDFVECGVWRGGASFLMASLLRQAGVSDRRVWLFDSFEGSPPPQELDGPAAALAWDTRKERPLPFVNSFEEVQQAAIQLGLTRYTELVKGWFDQTLPANRERVGPIAILRIDCDWYSSVRPCLDNFYDLVVDGGFIIVDDYYAFDGCANAVHDFLSERRLAQRIESVVGDIGGFDDHLMAMLRKGEITWKWTSQVSQDLQQIVALVPAGGAFILVDEDKWGTPQVVAGRRRIPFLERAGEYWGRPKDDATAISELRRLRQSGASLIAFTRPALWWLDNYSHLHHYLRSTFRCALENDRVVAFDLRQ